MMYTYIFRGLLIWYNMCWWIYVGRSHTREHSKTHKHTHARSQTQKRLSSRNSMRSSGTYLRSHETPLRRPKSAQIIIHSYFDMNVNARTYANTHARTRTHTHTYAILHLVQYARSCNSWWRSELLFSESTDCFEIAQTLLRAHARTHTHIHTYVRRPE